MVAVKCKEGCKCGKHSRAPFTKRKCAKDCTCGLHSESRKQILRERISGEQNINYKHGQYKRPSFHRWINMMERCHWNPIPHYGLRGITVCEEWHDPKVFLDYLESNLGPCPSGYSIDRIDNDGNYEPGNIRWASPSVQVQNQRRWKSEDK